MFREEHMMTMMGHDVVFSDDVSCPGAPYDVVVHRWWWRWVGQNVFDDDHNVEPIAPRTSRGAFYPTVVRYKLL